MTGHIQKQHDIVLRLQQATKEMQEARARRPKWRLSFPTDEEDAAERKRDAAIVDLRRAGVWPDQIAGHAEISHKEVMRILYEAGEAPEYEPVAKQDPGIRPPE